MTKTNLTKADYKIMRDAVRARIEVFDSMARHEESMGHKNSMREFCEKCNAYQEVLDKLNEVLGGMTIISLL